MFKCIPEEDAFLIPEIDVRITFIRLKQKAISKNNRQALKFNGLLNFTLITLLQQRIFDLMTLNLFMEPTFIVETMGLQWTSELSFTENVPILMKQFKKERALKPFKVIKVFITTSSLLETLLLIYY